MNERAQSPGIAIILIALVVAVIFVYLILFPALCNLFSDFSTAVPYC
jgi:hypothetical protein